MKSKFKRVLILSLFCFSLFLLSGCTTKNKMSEADIANDIQNMVTQGKQDAMNIGDDVSDSVEEAIKYIDTHAKDPFENHEITKQLAYYGSYLENVAGANAKHEIVSLGQNVRSFVSSIASGAEDEASEVSKALKNDIKSGLDNINATKDDMLSKFSDLIKNRGE